MKETTVESLKKRGFKFSEDGKILIRVPNNITTCNIPEGVTDIKNGAFFLVHVPKFHDNPCVHDKYRLQLVYTAVLLQVRPQERQLIRH